MAQLGARLMELRVKQSEAGWKLEAESWPDGRRPEYALQMSAIGRRARCDAQFLDNLPVAGPSSAGRF